MWDDGLLCEMIFSELEIGEYGFEYVDTEVDQITIYNYSLSIQTDNGQEADQKLTAEVIP